MKYDFAIIGGGIVGLSTAWQLLQKRPGSRIVLLEKERVQARHQTGRNSGVIHSGVYYATGSLKAEFCRQGAAATVEFCTARNIPFRKCGKLLVATDELERSRMELLYARALDNGVDVRVIDRNELAALEPNITGLGAIHVPETGVVDYSQVCRAMVSTLRDLGGEVRLSAEVVSLSEDANQVRIGLQDDSVIQARYLIACAGLQADRVVRLLGIEASFRIVPFRGEYFSLPRPMDDIVRHLIYPIPDPSLPFLGVHLTKMIDGSVTVGPNAVLGWKREGYSAVNFDWRDTIDMLRFPGFWRLMRAHSATGWREWVDSVWRRGYLKRVRRYCPSVELRDLRPHPVGIRAQAVRRDGSMIEDFHFEQSPRSFHVCNAPSPAATSAIPIGRYIVERVCQVN